jgi:transposase
MAPDLRALLPQGHEAFRFVETVRRLDMSAFDAVHRDDSVGRPPFDPRPMLALILYCRSKGFISTRQVAAACRDDIGARVIMGNRYPDRSTIDRFLSTHAAAIQGVLAQSIRLGQEEGLVDVSVIAGDGSFLLANAAMDATVDERRLRELIEDLEEKLVAAEQTWRESVGDPDVAVPTLFGDDAMAPAAPGRGENAAWRRMQSLRNVLHCRRQALAHLLAHPNRELLAWQERVQRDQERIADRAEQVEQVRAELQEEAERRQRRVDAGERISGTRPVPVEQHTRMKVANKSLQSAIAKAKATLAGRPTTAKVNTTDPISRIIPGKKHDFDQRHNVQVSACRGQFILAVGLHDNTNDKRALVALLTSTRTNLDAAGIAAPIGTAIFDAGYASQANFTADLPVEHLLVAVSNEARQTGRRTDPVPSGRAAPQDSIDAWADMAARLAQPANRALYKQRSAIIEPVFAQMFCRFGILVNQRGDDVLTELHLRAATHNFLKIHRQRARREARSST